MVDVDMNQEADPIRASYDVYIKPQVSNGRQIYILQFPNRDSRHHYSAANNSQPLKMRIKPKSGMVELDVPMDVWHNYDKEKGIKWGDAMKKSSTAKGGGSHGLPGGFGIGGAPAGGRRGRAAEEDLADLHDRVERDFAGAVEREHILVKQTLGGQSVPNEDTSPQYMIGTFRKGQLHLTPVDTIVQMRPQFHHIDAHSELDRAGRGRDPSMAAQARAIHMTVKTNIDGEEETEDTMAERISAAQSEAWKSHKFIDEDNPDAWEAYNQHLFVGTEAQLVDSEELLMKTTKLASVFDDQEYLDTISAPRDAAKLSRSKKATKIKKEDKGEGVEDATKEPESDGTLDLSDSDSDTEEVVPS